MLVHFSIEGGKKNIFNEGLRSNIERRAICVKAIPMAQAKQLYFKQLVTWSYT